MPQFEQSPLPIVCILSAKPCFDLRFCDTGQLDRYADLKEAGMTMVSKTEYILIIIIISASQPI